MIGDYMMSVIADAVQTFGMLADEIVHRRDRLDERGRREVGAATLATPEYGRGRTTQ